MAVIAAYEPTFRDFLSLNRWIARRRWRLVRTLSVLLIALYAASPALFHDLGAEGILLPYLQTLVVFAVPAAFLAGLPLALYLAAKKRWNTAPEIREPRRFTFSEDGIVVEGRTFSGRVGWPHIAGAESHRGLVILKTRQGIYFILRERCFTDEDQREAFASLVRKKVSPAFGRSSILGRVKFREPDRNVDRGA